VNLKYSFEIEFKWNDIRKRKNEEKKKKRKKRNVNVFQLVIMVVGRLIHDCEISSMNDNGLTRMGHAYIYMQNVM
jgi:hypothetical protein